MARPVIALLTDFGLRDHYVGAMKGVMLGICPEATLVDISHDVPPHDVMAGARSNFIENRVAPLCSRLEAEEDVTVKAIDRKAVGWFDIDSLPIMQLARRSRLGAAKIGFDMGIPFNELNRIFDLGFKPLPWGNDGYLPARLQKISGI